MSIRVLDTDTINKIAAGEVIERPMAVVKELLENAIDAGANSVTVEIKDGGKSLIRVTDNGNGISTEDVRLAFTPHATSKIKELEDLLSISTLGFRGEALASIASVSQLEMLSKTRNSLNGSRYVIEGGYEKEFGEAGCPDGTTFIVKNLFYNTPARLKFLKTPQTEASYISSVVEHMALSCPKISFRFISQNQPKLHTPGNGNLKDVIYNIFGKDIALNLLEVNSIKKSCEISGFTGQPVISRGNRSYINYFVNGRYIKSNIINHAIEEAYSPYMMNHKYPFTVLNFKIEPELIDVNVHPQKMELRFTNEKELYKDIYDTISETLKHKEFIPEAIFGKKEKQARKTSKNKTNNISQNDNNIIINGKQDNNTSGNNAGYNNITDKNNTIENNNVKNNNADTITINKNEISSGNIKTPGKQEENKVILRTPEISEINMLFGIEEDKTEAGGTENKTEEIQAYNITPGLRETAAYNAHNIEQETLFGTDITSPQADKDIKIIGQVFSTYWILQYGDNMFMVDQHAAHEKVLYERFIKQIESSKPLTQMLNPPVVASLSMAEQQVLEENIKIFEKFGYIIENFGGREYMLSGVPAQLPDINTEELFLEILDGLLDNKTETAPETLLSRIATMSCKAAVKGKSNLDKRQAHELLKELMALDNPYNCPHGRPVIIKITKREIERKFKRIL
ncbi:MAG: DNA mismatch repair endonuclease MutL [Lachnospiraceae bacterium]